MIGQGEKQIQSYIVYVYYFGKDSLHSTAQAEWLISRDDMFNGYKTKITIQKYIVKIKGAHTDFRVYCSTTSLLYVVLKRYVEFIVRVNNLT